MSPHILNLGTRWNSVSFIAPFITSYSNRFRPMLISGFRRDVDDICALLGYYTASCGNCLPTFTGQVSDSDSSREDGTDTLFRNSVNNYHTTPRNIPEERRSRPMLFLLIPILNISDRFMGFRT
jgi:hypothetical protein